MKSRRKRNVFKQEDQQKIQQSQTNNNHQQGFQSQFSALSSSNTGQPVIANKFQQYYDQKFKSVKLQENAMYYGENRQKRKKNHQDQYSQQAKKEEKPQEQQSNKNKRNVRKKKRDFLNLQDNQQEKPEKVQQQKQQNIKSIFDNNQNSTSLHYKNAFDQQKKEQQKHENSLSEQQEQKQGDHNINQMIQQKRQQLKQKPKQVIVNFKSLLDQAGNDKQLKKRIFYSPLAPKQRAACYFKRYQSGLSETYQLIGDDYRPLLFCQNQRGSIGANMYISLNKQMDKNSSSYLGKLRGNAAGSSYSLYDEGQTPSNKLNRSQWRITMAHIQYENNFMGMKGPRKLKIVTPKVRSDQQWDAFKLGQGQQFEKLPPNLLTSYRNKQPKWNQRLKSYALNFGGRVKMASIKNFILVNDEHQIQQEMSAPSVLIFGKIDQNTFSLQFTHPLSAFQAFGIVMSEFDFKINCE